MGKEPLFSVVVPAHNHEKYIGDCIQSVLNQTCGDFELIIINDGSSDDTERIIKAFSDERIKYFYQENHDAPYTINRGMQMAKGKYIAILNSDDLFEKDKLEKSLAVLEQGYEFVFGKLKSIDENNNPISEDNSRARWINKKLNDSGEQVFLNKLLLNINYFVTTSNFVFNKDIIEKVGYFHEKLHYSHDFDFLLRLFVNDIRMKFIPEFHAQYRMHSDNTITKAKTEPIIEVCYAIKKRLGIEKRGIVLPEELLKRPLYSSLLLAMLNMSEEELEKIIADPFGSKREELKRIAHFYIDQAMKNEKIIHDNNRLTGENNLITSSKFWRLRNEYMRLKEAISIENIFKKGGLFLRKKNRKIFHFLLRMVQLVLHVFTPLFFLLSLLTKTSHRNDVKKNPLVSVVIPCYNYGRYITEAVDSVLASTYQNLEIIILDDGPTDPFTIDLLKNLKKPKTRVIFQANAGLAVARNNGIKEAQGEFILPLDADDKIDPTYIEKAIYVLQKNPLCALTYGYVQVFGAADLTWYTGEYDLRRLKRENIIPSCTFFRRKAWEKVGGYEKDRHQYDDWTYWLKLGSYGFYGKLIPEVLFFHRKHEGDENMTERLKKRHAEYYQKIKDRLPKLFGPFSDIMIFIKKIFLKRREKFEYNDFEQVETSISDKKNKLIVFLPWASRGGAEKVTLDLMKNLNDYEVYLVTTLRNQYDPVVDLEFKKITKNVYYLPNFLKQGDYLWFVQNLIKRNRIKAILINHCAWAYENIEAIKKTQSDIGIFDLLHNTADEGYKNHSLRYNKFITKTIVISKEIERHLVDEFKISSNKVDCILNGIDLENTFNPSRLSMSEISKEIYFPEGKFIVSFIGRMGVEKNPLKFIAIANELKKKSPGKYFFIMVGGGELIDGAKKEISVNFDGREIIHLGNYSNPEKVLAVTNVLVNTSRIEGMPLTILESLAMEVPVIAPNVGGIAEIIENGKNGYLLEKDPSIDEYVQAIEKMVDSKDYAEMKKKARQSVGSFSSVEMAKKYEQIFGGKNI